MRLGDLDALKQELVAEMVKCMRMSEETKGSMAERVLNRVDEAPTIEAEPVIHSRWVEDRDGDEYCENCSRYMPSREVTGDPSAINYCPNCGAKMRGGAENA